MFQKVLKVCTLITATTFMALSFSEKTSALQEENDVSKLCSVLESKINELVERTKGEGINTTPEVFDLGGLARFYLNPEFNNKPRQILTNEFDGTPQEEIYYRGLNAFSTFNNATAEEVFDQFKNGEYSSGLVGAGILCSKVGFFSQAEERSRAQHKRVDAQQVSEYWSTLFGDTGYIFRFSLHPNMTMVRETVLNKVWDLYKRNHPELDESSGLSELERKIRNICHDTYHAKYRILGELLGIQVIHSDDNRELYYDTQFVI
ncbi:MAG: hypothetical protein LBI41_03995 [Lactobacillales bacterium]|jgi:hypothetical protein|nr:hypothetical protein [Lactobacillales bacterium]